MKILGRVITKLDASTLLSEKKTPVLSGFVSQKTGKPFDAMLTLDASGKVGFAFPPRTYEESIPFVPPIR